MSVRPSPPGAVRAFPESLREPAGNRVDAIVIGASAGGVEALLRLLPALPPGFEATVLVVLHMPREGRSLLVEVFAPHCAVPVREAVDKEPLEAGTVYFAAPDYHLMVDAGPVVALSVDEPVHFCRPAIDVLFESAVDVYRERLLGIVLTGGNEDGAAGLRAILAAGGSAVVQDPGTAFATYMPNAAIERNPTAAVGSLERIADLLRTLACKRPESGTNTGTNE